MCTARSIFSVQAFVLVFAMQLASAQDQGAVVASNAVLLQTVALLLISLLLNSLLGSNGSDLQYSGKERSDMWTPVCPFTSVID